MGQGAGGQGASGLLGTLAQSIGPMMQQLMVGDDRGSNAQGPTSSAPMRSSPADWKSALTELDGEEQAEWEKVIRCLPYAPSFPICRTVPSDMSCFCLQHFLLVEPSCGGCLFPAQTGRHKFFM